MCPPLYSADGRHLPIKPEDWSFHRQVLVLNRCPVEVWVQRSLEAGRVG